MDDKKEKKWKVEEAAEKTGEGKWKVEEGKWNVEEQQKRSSKALEKG